MNYLVEFENSRLERSEYVVYAETEEKLNKVIEKLEMYLTPACTWTLLSYIELDPT